MNNPAEYLAAALAVLFFGPLLLIILVGVIKKMARFFTQ